MILLSLVIIFNAGKINQAYSNVPTQKRGPDILSVVLLHDDRLSITNLTNEDLLINLTFIASDPEAPQSGITKGYEAFSGGRPLPAKQSLTYAFGRAVESYHVVADHRRTGRFYYVFDSRTGGENIDTEVAYQQAYRAAESALWKFAYLSVAAILTLVLVWRHGRAVTSDVARVPGNRSAKVFLGVVSFLIVLFAGRIVYIDLAGDVLAQVLNSITLAMFALTWLVFVLTRLWRSRGNLVSIEGEFRGGRLERFDDDGNRLPPIPIRISPWIAARGFSLNEGDKVEGFGRWKKHQFVQVKRIHNLTTDKTVQAWWWRF